MGSIAEGCPFKSLNPNCRWPFWCKVRDMPLAYPFKPLAQLKNTGKPVFFSWWARRDLNPQGCLDQRILSPSRIPIPPLARYDFPIIL